MTRGYNCIDSRGKTTVPARNRRAFNLRSGDRIHWDVSPTGVTAKSSDEVDL
jgi:bifunctional DNA-binding transcriptional regulator/antitoxin component of YhaV-PrlF toxin-antitoxin module